MDGRKVFLEKNRGKFSVNAESDLMVNLSAKTRVLPYDDIDTTMSIYDLYNDERDACNKFRMIFTINPICTNALFNSRTEVVRYEGSPNVKVLLDNKVGDKGRAKNSNELTIHQAIRDTEYSYPGLFDDRTPYVYHCGWDIYNNHRLRAKEFIYTSKVNDSDAKSKPVFNTISDYMRDYDGKIVKEYIGLMKNAAKYGGGKGDVTSTGETELHMYRYDSINSIYEAFAENTDIQNGWYGFTNTCDMLIPNYNSGDTWSCINKVMNNNKPCEFIDFYPDRSLYSFIPKVNRYRKRIEKNWEYCITYPNKKEDLTIFGWPVIDGCCPLKIVDCKLVYLGAGVECLRFVTQLRHSLMVNDYITLFKEETKNETKYQTKYQSKIKVFSVGDEDGNYEDKIFSIKLSDASKWFSVNGQGTLNYSGKLYFKKNVNGYDCQYYFRKFKKLMSIDGKELKSEINKVAYGENIYGDRIAQIIFTDDIDVEGIVDHMGRKLSELYLTIFKTNKGHKEWYDMEDYGSENVEFSHCFGELSSGLDMGIDNDSFDYNVHRLTNIKYNDFNDRTKDIIVGAFSGDVAAKSLEFDITINEDEFYGDIVEFDTFNYIETVLENVQYRFNTAQRETNNKKYFNILYDRLDFDDFDSGINEKVSGETESFKVTSGYINTIEFNTLVQSENDDKLFAGNLNPEGYYYKAHNKIQIRDIDDSVSSVIGKSLNYNSGTVDYVYSGGTKLLRLELTSIQNLLKYETIALFDTETKDIKWGYVDKYDNEPVSGTILPIVHIQFHDIGSIKIEKFQDRKYVLLIADDGVPQFATYLENSQTFVWRDVVRPSSLTNESELFDMPFSNGCFYIETNINFFLKRQDPRNDYFMLSPEIKNNKQNPLKSYNIWGYDSIDLSGVVYKVGKMFDVCV